ncbi:alpha/beta hydrolase [Actinoplanes derwentensis]|uniref:Alpha/beta hydrolase fold n=1 Tax=Actinoplanes derwentensis TaxID=113562 RepID=A0A1H2CN70_9ACTN|nr:alpha/beta hydrolase [Actinoplanes derwentensis]GID88594.1 peptidase [Actinoplanes derwentensis]SDT71933.1 alpha/beta hydrolase fold [Actinoplanes derwentensis]
MRRFWAAAAAVALCTAGAGVTGARAETARGGPAPIAWSACTEGTLKSHSAECGFLSVPMDYAEPGGTKIQIAVSRIKATAPAAERQGVILVNPGGPGGAGRNLATLGQNVPKKAGAAYDWIGFDPRGVGASKPKLTCDSTYTGYQRPPYVPDSAEIEKQWHARTTGYAAACAKAGGALLDHMRTEDTVRDIDSIRQALAEEKISFYGFSYGTYLAQAYATRNPERVHRMVLDGVVNPGRVWYRANLDQDVAFEKAIKVYFKWVAKYDSVYHLGRTPAAVSKTYYRQLAALAGKPAGGKIGPAELTDVFLQAGYYVFDWEEIARAFSALVNRKDAVPLRRLYDGNRPKAEGSDNGYAVYLAVQCTDAPWPASWKKWARDNWRTHRKAPFETWGNAWYNAPCRHWAADPGTPIEVDGAKAPPILLISETLDAATPYAGALETRRRFPRSVLVEGVGGTTHAGSLYGHACVDNTIADYLATGALPGRVKADRSDKQCEPIAKPTPLAPDAKKPAGAREELRRLIDGR